MGGQASGLATSGLQLRSNIEGRNWIQRPTEIRVQRAPGEGTGGGCNQENNFLPLKAAENSKGTGSGPVDEPNCGPRCGRRDRTRPLLTSMERGRLASGVGEGFGVGKRIRSLTKHSKPRIQAVAADLFKFWKNFVIEETSKACKSSEDRKILKSEVKSEKSDIIKVEKTANSSPPKPFLQSNSEFIKIERLASDKDAVPEKLLSSHAAVKIEKTTKGESLSSTTSERNNAVEPVKIDRTMKSESTSSAAYERSDGVVAIKVEEKKISTVVKPLILNTPPKLTSMIKCNDPMRDKLRELLHESFSKVPPEASEDERHEVRDILDEINARDPIRVAVTVESTMFEKLGRSNGTNKVKYRSIMFNLKDSKNTDLRRRVLLGHIIPEKLIDMSAEEMASDERKLSNKQIQEKALIECERAAAPKATTDQFKCGRCGQRKCTYYQLQTRSADEPMTTFVTCVNCNNHWKFC
ncbi:hypothetical protein KSP40_PGU002553 [Platanthera guangdongensis]|uniref:Transcription elongation factor TFIIS n=1 Tax=Platanthera guangdongensis TaxID=2320717 RepID=A0ABR2MG37_9ASPA